MKPAPLALRPSRLAAGAAIALAVLALAMAARFLLIEPRDMAQPSTPVAGTPFFKIDHAS